MRDEQEHYTPEETEQRLRKTLKAAFNMKPTPLKDIPKRRGDNPRKGVTSAKVSTKP